MTQATPTDTGDTGNIDTGGTGNTDTGDTGNTDTGDTGNIDTGGTGNTETGDTGNTDTGDTGNIDTGGTGNTDTGNTSNTDAILPPIDMVEQLRIMCSGVVMHHISGSEAGSEGRSDDNAENRTCSGRTLRRTSNLASWNALTTIPEPMS